MSKPVTIRYYQINVSGNDGPQRHQITAALSRALADLPNYENYINYTPGGYDYVLADGQLEVDRLGFYFGTFVKNQVEDIAKFNSHTGTINPPRNGEFADGDGVGREKCFMIDPAANILCVESRQGAASIGSLLRWLEANLRRGGGHDFALNISVVIRPDALAKYTAMDHMYKVRIKMADVTDAHHLNDGGRRALKDLTGNADDSDADEIELTLKTSSEKRGANRDSLKVSWIKDKINTLLRRNRPEHIRPRLTSVYIEGVNDSGEIERFDLIKDELKDVIRVEQSAQRIVTTFNAGEHIAAIANNYRPIRQSVLDAYNIATEI